MDNMKVTFYNGVAVVQFNGFSVLLADGRMFEMGTDKYLGKFDSDTEAPSQVLNEQEAGDHGICIIEHYKFWCRFHRPKTKS